MIDTRVLFDAEDVRRAVRRIAHQVLEHNDRLEDLVVVGLRTRGVPLAERLCGVIHDVEGRGIPLGELDVSLYRDDVQRRGPRALQPTAIPVDITEKVVLLVDDVLYTGRTVRAALDAVMDLGRPRAIQLVCLVDRGHRELPIRADYVGKNIPTAQHEHVAVHIAEIDGVDEVVLMRRARSVGGASAQQQGGGV